jgi:hypothetical protein
MFGCRENDGKENVVTIWSLSPFLERQRRSLTEKSS